LPGHEPFAGNIRALRHYALNLWLKELSDSIVIISKHEFPNVSHDMLTSMAIFDWIFFLAILIFRVHLPLPWTVHKLSVPEGFVVAVLVATILISMSTLWFLLRESKKMLESNFMDSHGNSGKYGFHGQQS
jgi:hypothetical protein